MFSEREGRNRMWLYKIKAHVSLKKFTPILKGLWHCPIMSKQEVTVPHVAMNIFISILQRCVWEQQKGLNGEEETVWPTRSHCHSHMVSHRQETVHKKSWLDSVMCIIFHKQNELQNKTGFSIIKVWLGQQVKTDAYISILVNIFSRSLVRTDCGRNWSRRFYSEINTVRVQIMKMNQPRLLTTLFWKVQLKTIKY